MPESVHHLTAADVIERWPSASVLAAQIGEKDVTVRAWKQRGIPARVWKRLVEVGSSNGITVSLDELATLAAKGEAA